MIKKILKKKVWEFIIPPGSSQLQKTSSSGLAIPSEDWVCLKRGLMIYFGNKINWSKDTYRLFREYITDGRIRDEMAKESPEVQAFVQSFSNKK